MLLSWKKNITFILVILFLNVFILSSEGTNLGNESFDEYIYGLDVSSWQDAIDWALVSNDGYQFCFAKATEGVGWTDGFFETNMNAGNAAGLYMGAYHFATPTVDDAVDEAEYFVSVAGEYITEGYLKPVLDLEQGSELGSSVLSDWVHDWMGTVEDQTGVQPIIYVNSNYATNYLDNSVTCYDLWIAHWTYDPSGTPDTGIWENWTFWQYSDQGSVGGISGNVDLNAFNAEMTQLESFIIQNDIVYVDDDADSSWYDATHVRSIQEGIDNASSGDTVFVYNGTYFENVIVEKSVDLIGEHKLSTIIDGGLNGDVLTVTVDDVRIMNVTIQHSGEVMYVDIAVRISGNTCSFNDNIVAHSAGAMYLSNSMNCTVENNIFYNCTHDVIIDEVVNNTVKNNTIKNCRSVHLIDSNNNMISYNQIINTSSGFYVQSSNNNTFSKNNLSNNGDESYAGFGLLLEGSSCFNLIELNHICNNKDEGIWLYSESNNNIIKNNFITSNKIGVFFGNTIVDNRVFHNNFYNNTLYNARDYGSNIWDDGYPSGGNYWDDYTGIDADGDEVGDTPYDIVGGINQDLFPFMNEDGWIELDINQSSYDRGFPIRHAVDGDWAAAQNFTPALDYLASAEIYLRKFGTPEFNLTVELREDHPLGTLVDTVTFIPSEIPTSWTWLELDFLDKPFTPETQYFIVLPPAPSSVTTSFGYEWAYAFGNQYDDGAFWFTRDGGGLWRDLPTMYEFTFRIYGYN